MTEERNISAIIASRTWFTQTEEKTSVVEIRVYQPIQADDASFSCTVEIVGPGEAIERRDVFGADSLQSLLLGLRLLSSFVIFRRQGPLNHLYWTEEDARAGQNEVSGADVLADFLDDPVQK